jgi:hypothetical protein
MARGILRAKGSYDYESKEIVSWNWLPRVGCGNRSQLASSRSIEPVATLPSGTLRA